MREYSSPSAACQPAWLPRVDGWWTAFRDLLLPPTCLLCLDPGQSPGLDLCAGCEADLPRIPDPCPRCARPQGRTGCRACRRRPPPWDRAIVAGRYDFPLAALVGDLKYRDELSRGRVLGTLLGRAVCAAGTRAACVLPVPLHAGRERERGYNQAHELARYAARAAGLPLQARLCRRRRATASQAGLPRRLREANLRDAFVLAASPPSSVAIVDDVLTSGATAGALARALRAGGARWIEVWAAARA